ncbi:transcription factor bHLH93-like [Mercurialis annua]|uniref:transcription factor bHLH93-like n=1 Tax=Mercurialis annua TaxID=3986 RepID=UPI00215EB397|nr:transcription factor bHLH93-like [Mercurialis annua]
MELSHHGFLEELLQAPTIRDNHSTNWPTNFSTTVSNDQFFSNGSWNNFDSFDENNTSLSSSSATPNPSSFLGLPTFDCSNFHDQTYPFFDGLITTTVPSAELNDHSGPFQTQENYPSFVEDEELGSALLRNHSFDERLSCKAEINNNNNCQIFNVGLSSEKKNKSKKVDGQPSKNLMAERRRRKRLNDRLSMLRSIVPKISKMDRTSILGDTIDYMKELLEKINKLQEEENSEESTNEMTIISSLNEIKPNEVLIRNSPKFKVDRREIDTRIDICCSSKPGLLLSTVNTLEALGLEIQQCVISCFNDFSVQASCLEEAEQRTVLSPEEIKQALFRTAGYGGRCL